MKKVACYVRVSTENQLENYSIDEQTERLKSYCKAKDYTIYRIYTDGGYSGGNTNRPALQEMLKDTASRKVDAVLVYKLDRLSRSQKDTLSLIEDGFLANGVDFISMSENFDTSSPFGRAMIGILSVFAQLEKDQITERFTMGRIGRSKSGLFHGGGNAPRGYDYIDGKLVVNLVEASQIKEIYQLFLSGKSINAISVIINQQYQCHLNATQVLNALRNSIYIGKVKFNGTEYDGQHEPLVAKEDFDRVQEILNSSEREASKNTAQKNPFRAGYFLSGLLFCGHCGAKYAANNGYYKCYSRSKCSRRFIKDPNCKNKNWVIGELDTLIMQEIHNTSLDGNYQHIVKNAIPQETFDEAKIRREIAKIHTQINKLIDLYQISDVPLETVSQKIQSLNTEKENYEKLLSTPRIDRLKQFESNLHNFLEISQRKDADTEAKRLSLSTLVERIVINEEDITIFWRV